MVLLQYISKRGLHFRVLRHFIQPDSFGDARATIHSNLLIQCSQYTYKRRRTLMQVEMPMPMIRSSNQSMHCEFPVL